MTGPRILTLDIETLPALVFSFETRNVNIRPEQIVEPVRMSAFGAKWLDGKRVMFFSEHHDDRETMVRAVHALLDQADVVVTYNGDNFDIPHINREIELLNLDTEGERLKDYSPFVSVDLYKVIKKRARWMSHRLAYITERLELTGKLQHYGFEMWVDCFYGEEKAWNLKRRYCKRDVVTTEELFLDQLPHIKNLPSAALWDAEPGEGPPKCSCGSERLHRRGYAVSRSRRYPRFQCQDCGRWHKGTRSEGSVNIS